MRLDKPYQITARFRAVLLFTLTVILSEYLHGIPYLWIEIPIFCCFNLTARRNPVAGVASRRVSKRNITTLKPWHCHRKHKGSIKLDMRTGLTGYALA